METNNTENHGALNNLESRNTIELVTGINDVDKSIAFAVEIAIPEICKTINAVFEKITNGGRLFYIGAGTSGRLGILDASECPPTYGVPQNMVIGIIAGGDTAIRKAVEFAEDNLQQGFVDLKSHFVSTKDFVIGISASGNAPYVYGALDECKKNGIATASIVCNYNSRLKAVSDFCIEVITGPEFVTGSTRMKAGTATKMVLNIISTSTMIKLGKVKGNNMVDMQLNNKKLIARGVRMIMENTKLSEEEATKKLILKGSVRAVIDEEN